MGETCKQKAQRYQYLYNDCLDCLTEKCEELIALRAELDAANRLLETEREVMRLALEAERDAAGDAAAREKYTGWLWEMLEGRDSE